MNKEDTIKLIDIVFHQLDLTNELSSSKFARLGCLISVVYLTMKPFLSHCFLSTHLKIVFNSRMKQVFLANEPTGAVTPAHFSVREVPVPFGDGAGGFNQSKMDSGHIVVEVTAMSVDPYMRSRMGGKGAVYAAAWKAGETIESHCVGVVVASRCSKLPNGTMVFAMMKWNEFCLLDGSADYPKGPMELPKLDGLAGKETLFLGVFGIPGLTGK